MAVFCVQDLFLIEGIKLEAAAAVVAVVRKQGVDRLPKLHRRGIGRFLMGPGRGTCKENQKEGTNDWKCEGSI